jgi:hypothetical protein
MYLVTQKCDLLRHLDPNIDDDSTARKVATSYIRVQPSSEMPTRDAFKCDFLFPVAVGGAIDDFDLQHLL